jgi:thiol-disulfide isomerase/thioredoxin
MRWIVLVMMVLLGCGSTQVEEVVSGNTELVVTYEGKEAHRRGGGYISFSKLKEIVEDGKPSVVLFGAPWCKACDILKKALIQAKLNVDVYWINVDTKWGRQLASVMAVKTIPAMEHIDSEGNTVAQRVGPGPIVVYLLGKF